MSASRIQYHRSVAKLHWSFSRGKRLTLPPNDDDPKTSKAQGSLAASARHTAAFGKAETLPRTKGLSWHREPPGSYWAYHPVLPVTITSLPTGQHSAIARQSPTSLQNALQQAHGERQGHRLTPVGKMALVTPSPSRLVTRTSLLPSLQNGAARWAPESA